MTTTRRHSRVWVVVLAVLAVTAAGANWFFNFHHSGDSVSTGGPTSTEADKNDQLRVVAFGHVDVEFGVRSLHPLQPGRVAEVLVHEGDAVKAGAALLKLDQRQAQYLIRQAQADLEAARAVLEQAKKSPAQHRSRIAQQKSAVEAARDRWSAAKRILARKQDLVKINQLNEADARAAEDLAKEAEAGVRAEEEKLRELQLLDPEITVTRARQDVAAKQARVEQAEHGLEECTLRAPADGEVLRVLTGPGDVLGAQPKQPAVLFCPAGPRFIRAEVSQEFADRVRKGQPALIQDDSRAAQTWRGRVSHISDWYTHRRSILQEPLQVNDIRTLECSISVDPGQPPLRIGQRMRVILGGDE
jgi:HlyD family secretion protein